MPQLRPGAVKKRKKNWVKNSKSLNRNNNNNNFNNREKGWGKKNKPRTNKANQNIKVIINVFLGFLCLCCAPQPVSVFLVFWRRTKSDPMLETVSLMFFSDLFFIVVVIIIIHNDLPPRTLPLCLLKWLCSDHKKIIWPCLPVNSYKKD